MSESPKQQELIPRVMPGDEEHFFDVRIRMVKRGKDWLVDTKYLKRALTPHLIKVP